MNSEQQASERASRESLPERCSALAARCSLLARLFVGGILLYAGFIKAVGPTAEFAGAIAAYKILPPLLVTPLSVGLPYVEMWVGIFLIFGFYTRPASLIASVMFAVFLAAVGSALARGIDLATCGCFGAETLAPRYTIFLDIILLFLCLYSAFRLKNPPISLDSWLKE